MLLWKKKIRPCDSYQVKQLKKKKEVGVLDAVGAMALLMEILLDFVYVTL